MGRSYYFTISNPQLIVHVSTAVTIIMTAVTTSTTTNITAATVTTIKAKIYETQYDSLYSNVI
jgi:hypothetical protein